MIVGIYYWNHFLIVMVRLFAINFLSLLLFFSIACQGYANEILANNQANSLVQINEALPESVEDAFDQRYKGATNTVWENREKQFKATFQYKGKMMFAFFDINGVWKKSFTKVATTDLPVSVMLYIQENLDGYELNRHYLRADTERESYAIAVKKGTDYVWMQFDLDGKFISSQV